MRSLGVCFALSLAYSFASFLAGWVAGAQGVLGQVTLLDQPSWAPVDWPTWLPGLIVALLLVAIIVALGSRSSSLVRSVGCRNGRLR